MSPAILRTLLGGPGGRGRSARRQRLVVEWLEDRIALATYYITNVQQLQAMEKDLNGTYILANDIDASSTQSWYLGFEPVGSSTRPFTGALLGQGHVISGLYSANLE
ncbi:MAG: hypothetical protein FJ271_04870 [Planctomycetes bacterium]|nr:hypothetical protein [Planctomycetota bacterium]